MRFYSEGNGRKETLGEFIIEINAKGADAEEASRRSFSRSNSYIHIRGEAPYINNIAVEKSHRGWAKKPPRRTL